MQIKEIFKNSFLKTKNVLKRLKSTLTTKRFSFVTLILTLILCFDLYSCIVTPCSRSPTAHAMDIVGERVVVTPSVRTRYRYGTASASYLDGATIQPLYISFTSHGVADALYNFYMPTENTNYQYSKYSFTAQGVLNGLPVYQVNFPLSLLFTRVNSTTNVDYNALTQSYGLTASVVIRNADFININPSYCNVYNANEGFILNVFTPSTSYKGIYYQFRDINGVALYELYLTYNINRGFSFETDSFTSIYTEVTTTFDFEDALAYDRGYDDGFRDGYIENGGNFTPLTFIKNSVNQLLSIEIFPNVTLSLILQLAFGMVLLGVAIKVFMGG